MVKRIGYLGPDEGTFSAMAARRIAENGDELVPLSSRTIFKQLGEGAVSVVAVPIENSSDGLVPWTITGFVGGNTLEPLSGREVIVPVRHCLMSRGAGISEIRRVYSHPQVWGQCDGLMSSELSGVETVDCDSTSSAARIVAGSDDRSLAAIGTIKAAEINGLQVIQNGVQDSEYNETRFIGLSRENGGPTDCDKTAIVFTLPNRFGALYRFLKCLYVAKVNMTVIDSHPVPEKRLGQYIFFAEIEGYKSSYEVLMAFRLWENLGSDFPLPKVIASYSVAPR